MHNRHIHTAQPNVTLRTDDIKLNPLRRKKDPFNFNHNLRDKNQPSIWTQKKVICLANPHGKTRKTGFLCSWNMHFVPTIKFQEEVH